jgi:uncharacterized protein YbbC (DUF1343 family)
MAQRPFSFFLLTLGAQAGGCAGGEPAPVVRPGIEVLLSDSAHLVRGVRVGILTNQTGVDRQGRSDVDLLVAAGIQLTAIFSPEHGFRGNLDRENIENSVDSATGVPIFSLYGPVRAPTREMLERIDLLLVDLQDIGARPYTYISTALLAMQAARQQGQRRVVILDRPNPLGGVAMQGPLLDTAFASFVGMLPVPLRHGLTLGELARFGNDALGIGADLVVVPAAGWRRGAWFDETGLPWVRPSPNMPDGESATHYPGLVLFEATNLSVGRGTSIAFQMVGASWLDAAGLIARLPAVPGVSFADTTVFPEAPGDGKYGGEEIQAVRLRVTNRRLYNPPELAVQLLLALRSLHRDSLRIDPRLLDQRAGSDGLRRAIERGYSPNRIWNAWRAELDAFARRREAFLLY